MEPSLCAAPPCQAGCCEVASADFRRLWKAHPGRTLWQAGVTGMPGGGAHLRFGWKGTAQIGGAREAESPGQLHRLADADAGAGHHQGPTLSRQNLEGRLVERGDIGIGGKAERLAE